jgi:hypothetical protein
VEAPGRQWEVEEHLLHRVLAASVTALEADALPFMLMGGLASAHYGRPRWTHDIDLLVAPQNARMVLSSLEGAGFRTEETDPSWLFKAFREEVLVDVIFRCAGEIYLDDEMRVRTRKADIGGTSVPLIPPEDLLVIKTIVHNEQNPRHWHDALGLLVHCDLDWAYLLRRARHGPRRVLSLLLYAQSVDITVPPKVIGQLYASVAPATSARRRSG